MHARQYYSIILLMKYIPQRGQSKYCTVYLYTGTMLDILYKNPIASPVFYTNKPLYTINIIHIRCSKTHVFPSVHCLWQSWKVCVITIPIFYCTLTVQNCNTYLVVTSFLISVNLVLHSCITNAAFTDFKHETFMDCRWSIRALQMQHSRILLEKHSWIEDEAFVHY